MGNIAKLLQLCLLGSVCQTRRHSENSASVRMEKRICHTKLSDVDETAGGYDFISLFGLSEETANDTETRRMIPGSNRQQTAYKVGGNFSDLRVSTRSVFPHGLPVQFSFTTTLRMTTTKGGEALPQGDWDIFRIADDDDRAQFSVTINDRKKSVRLKYISSRNKIRSAEFSLDNQYFIKFFNSEWHKLSLSVSRHLVQLYIDCDKVGSSVIPSLGSINASGQISSGRRTDGDPVAFDLQWLMIYCDPRTAKRDKCRELRKDDDKEKEAKDKELQNRHHGKSVDDNYRRYSAALTPPKRTLRDLDVDYQMAAQPHTGIFPFTAPTTTVNKKKFTKDRPPQLLKSGPKGPPGPPGSPGLPGLPGLPCMCRPGEVPLQLPIDIQEFERNH